MPISKSRHKVIHKLNRYPMLIHGDLGSGKTTLAAQFDAPYFLMFEKSDEYSLFKDNVTNWPQCVEFIQEFLEGNHEYKTIVFDNIDIFWQLAVDHFIDTFNLTKKEKDQIISLTGIGYAQGYDAVDKIICTVLNPVIMSNKYSVIFIAHTETRDFTSINGDSFQKLSPQLPSKRGRKYFLSGSISNIFYYFFTNNQRFIRIVGNDFIVAKNHGENHFLTTKGEPIINVPAGKSAKEAYQYLQAAYHCKLKNSYNTIQ